MRFVIAALAAAVAVAAIADSQSPVVSPDGSRIAFTSNRDGTSDLYVMAADGSRVVRLTHTADQEGAPSWSTDGTALRFAVPGKESSRLYSAAADGSKITEIGQVPGRAILISADGKRVLYALGTWTEVKLMESDLDGANARQLTDGSSVVWTPRWSPDRKRISFTSRRDGVLQIYSIDARGSDLRQITHFDPADGQPQSAAWSPDGRRFALQAGAKGKTFIWIVEAATGAAKKLTAHDEAYLDEVPSWFPDGKSIAFQSNRSGRMEIFVINVDGSAIRQLTR